MNFKELLLVAKKNEAHALEELAAMYRPLLIKESIVNGMFDEDLYQEYWLIFLNCLQKFNI
jgi:hypothetical protein